MHPELQSVKTCTPCVLATGSVMICWLSYAICSAHVPCTGVEGRAEAVDHSFSMVCSCCCGPRHFRLCAMVQSVVLPAVLIGLKCAAQLTPVHSAFVKVHKPSDHL